MLLSFHLCRNPQANLQVMGRVHSIGQMKQVYVFHFVTEDRVEKHMLERAAQKLWLDQLVFTVCDGARLRIGRTNLTLIVLSTTEGEYVAATHAVKEALWLRSLISEVFGDTLEATTLFSDNQSAIALSKDHQYHARTKHIDI